MMIDCGAVVGVDAIAWSARSSLRAACAEAGRGNAAAAASSRRTTDFLRLIMGARRTEAKILPDEVIGALLQLRAPQGVCRSQKVARQADCAVTAQSRL